MRLQLVIMLGLALALTVVFAPAPGVAAEGQVLLQEGSRQSQSAPVKERLRARPRPPQDKPHGYVPLNPGERPGYDFDRPGRDRDRDRDRGRHDRPGWDRNRDRYYDRHRQDWSYNNCPPYCVDPWPDDTAEEQRATELSAPAAALPAEPERGFQGGYFERFDDPRPAPPAVSPRAESVAPSAPAESGDSQYRMMMKAWQ